MNETDIHNLIDRLYSLELAYKGFTTRLKILEAEVEKLRHNK